MVFSGCLNGKAVSEHLCFLILANFCGLLPWLRHQRPTLFDEGPEFPIIDNETLDVYTTNRKVDAVAWFALSLVIRRT